jgi:hypothetical protein
LKQHEQFGLTAERGHLARQGRACAMALRALAAPLVEHAGAGGHGGEQDSHRDE